MEEEDFNEIWKLPLQYMKTIKLDKYDFRQILSKGI